MVDNYTHFSNDLFELAGGLPEWVIRSISEIAWDRGHAYGQCEVDKYAEDMIDTFYRNMGK